MEIPSVKLISEPTVIPLASMELDPEGLNALYDWVKENRAECLPEEPEDRSRRGWSLFPHEGREGTGNELLGEIAGRTCYMSFGAKAGRKSNAAYLAHTQAGPHPHRSILYHPKMSFFLGGISRALSHELIRHYVGADREEEGSPSQESTRYTEHPGSFVIPPRIAGNPTAIREFRGNVTEAYREYRRYLDAETRRYREENGSDPKGLERKRIYEDAAMRLPASASTSFVWTTNPIAIRKLLSERADESANLEIARLARKWAATCELRWPGFFPAEVNR